ncbi:MAG: hypothetical protein HOV92_00495 [Streptomyces sp.]|nr:hypothetical protein [Streptomyces sp.]
MPSYNDVQKAVRAEKRGIWFAWFTGGVIWLIITNATKHVPIVSVVTQVLLVVLGIVSTWTALRMSNALSRREEQARREVLGDE